MGLELAGSNLAEPLFPEPLLFVDGQFWSSAVCAVDNAVIGFEIEMNETGGRARATGRGRDTTSGRR